MGGVQTRPPWSDRRRRTLVGLALGIVAFGLGAIGLPGEYGAKAALVAALCAFLLGVAAVVFVVVPGPDTLGTLLRSVPLAGACLVVAVLLLLSTDDDLRWLWWTAVVLTGGWTAAAVWQTRRSGA
jgi:peptidoglycan/LPS O-acetylase OafA/YrhL